MNRGGGSVSPPGCRPCPQTSIAGGKNYDKFMLPETEQYQQEKQNSQNLKYESSTKMKRLVETSRQSCFVRSKMYRRYDHTTSVFVFWLLIHQAKQRGHYIQMTTL